MHLRFLLLLAACRGPAPGGAYQIELGDPSTDCPADAVPTAPTLSVVGVESTGGPPTVRPFGACEGDARSFVCELSPWDAVDDLADVGLDAVNSVDVTFTGGGKASALTGLLSWTTACVGADCATAAALPSCTTTWTYTGVHLSDREASEVESCEEPELGSPGPTPLGPAAWDPLVGPPSPDGVAAFVVGGPDGVEGVTPLVVEGLVTAGDGLYLVDGATPGVTYDAPGAWSYPDEPRWEATLCPDVPTWNGEGTTWTVGSFGRDASFDPEAIVGAWALRPGIFLPSVLTAVIGTSLDGMRLEVLGVGDGGADIRIVAPYLDGPGECVVLADRAAISATGELTWGVERIEADAEPAPLVLHAPRLRIGFDGAGTAAAGGEFDALIDVRATEGTETDLCSIATSFASGCRACPDDGHVSCLPLGGLAWQAEPSDVEVGAELPLCGADFTGDVVPDIEIDCGDWDGTLCAVSGLLVLLPFRRRSRAGRGAPGP